MEFVRLHEHVKPNAFIANRTERAEFFGSKRPGWVRERWVWSIHWLWRLPSFHIRNTKPSSAHRTSATG